MSVAQKLGAMEKIWDSLAADSDKLPTPSWHLEILAARKAAVASGQARFTEWSAAKDEIRRRAKS